MTGDRTPSGNAPTHGVQVIPGEVPAGCVPPSTSMHTPAPGGELRERLADALGHSLERWWQTPPHLIAAANAVLPVVEAETDAYRELLGCIWLYVDWRYVTRQLTTEQKELWADAVETTGDPEDPVTADRWWRE